MQLIRNIFKYLDNISIDYIKLDTFNDLSTDNFINYTPTIDFFIKSNNDCSFNFTNVQTNKPIIYNFNVPCNLSDRKSIEVDVYSPFDIGVGSVTLDICSGVNGNAIRGSFKNDNALESGHLTTLTFDLGNKNNVRLREYSSIRSVKLTFTVNELNLCAISGYNGEYLLTYDDLVSLIGSSANYVKNKINLSTIPLNEPLFEAIYKLTAYYIWQRETTTPRNTKKSYDYLKNEANELIKYYLTGGYHPVLEPFTDTVSKKNKRVWDNDYNFIDKNLELIKILSKQNEEYRKILDEIGDLV